MPTVHQRYWNHFWLEPEGGSWVVSTESDGDTGLEAGGISFWEIVGDGALNVLSCDYVWGVATLELRFVVPNDEILMLIL